MTLHHAFYELGMHSAVQKKLRQEITENLGSETDLSFEKLHDLPYLDQVFNETLRLHPPLPFTTRVCSEDFETNEFKNHKIYIRKETAVWIPIYSIHRDPGLKSINNHFVVSNIS